MKNVMDAYHTHMQDVPTFYGWMLVNHLTLQRYQHFYLKLKKKPYSNHTQLTITSRY